MALKVTRAGRFSNSGFSSRRIWYTDTEIFANEYCTLTPQWGHWRVKLRGTVTVQTESTPAFKTLAFCQPKILKLKKEQSQS